MRKLLLVIFLLSCISLSAQNIKGSITTHSGPLPFASILVKGTTIGTTANEKGEYALQLSKGNYVLICQYVGYTTVEKKVQVISGETTIVNFDLSDQQYSLKGVEVKSGQEDPAYEIIRNAIKKRPVYEKEIKKLQAEVYIKGKLMLRDYPDKIFGQKVEFEDGSSDEYLNEGDSARKKMLFLSETVSRYSVDYPKYKVEVLSTRVSGQSGGLGLGSPIIISFYNNNISLGSNLNPRGFISPIANNALQFYRYKYEGSFYENGMEISRIKVIPKRKYEPLFSGYINIIEDEWRIHSVKLKLFKDQQLQLMDTFSIDQIYIPAGKVWLVKQQVFNVAIKIFKFDAYGSYVQVFDKFNLNPKFNKDFFNNTVFEFRDSANKKDVEYWDTIRPLPLAKEEVSDYHKKDSIEKIKNSPEFRDSVDRRRNKFSPFNFLLFGYTYSVTKNKISYSIEPLIDIITYNTVEGTSVYLPVTIKKTFSNHQKLEVTPAVRYGFSNEHFNAALALQYDPAFKRKTLLNVRGGKMIFQFNNENVISPRNNTISTLWWKENLMKIYEAGFVEAGFSKSLDKGFWFSTGISFQHRMPLVNTSFQYIREIDNVKFTPNYPVEITNHNLPEHNAFTASARLRWLPGSRYVKLPERIINIGSKFPFFDLQFDQGIDGILNSETRFAKWNLSVKHKIDFKLQGAFHYHIGAGGFLENTKSYIPDYKHFKGNAGILSSEYLNSFQLVSLYRLSNNDKFYRYGHIEYHLNGFISNKIPGFKKLNWFFVVGGNGINIDQKFWHYEVFFSVENILKIIRVDFIKGFEKNGVTMQGIRINLPNIF